VNANPLSRQRSSYPRSRGSPTCFDLGCPLALRLTSVVRRRSASCRPTIRSIQRSSPGGRPGGRPLQSHPGLGGLREGGLEGGLDPRPTAVRARRRHVVARAPLRMAGSSSIAASHDHHMDWNNPEERSCAGRMTIFIRSTDSSTRTRSSRSSTDRSISGARNRHPSSARRADEPGDRASNHAGASAVAARTRSSCRPCGRNARFRHACRPAAIDREGTSRAGHFAGRRADLSVCQTLA
jgi:hypothetical protein